MDEATPPATLTEEEEDKIIAMLSDFHEGELTPEQRAQVEQHLAADARWRALDEELRAARPLLAALGKATSPPELERSVTAAIHQRSAGRFFGKRALADRVPAGLALAIAAVLLGAMTTVWCRSSTGSLRAPTGGAPPAPPPAERLAPTP
ncbi:MAG: zf-HC2 domain-containing protein [Kofleriaceae bacterium]